MPAPNVIKPDLRGVKLVPGGRYMINKAQAGPHGCPVYPFNQVMMDSNKNLVEFFPKFKEVAVTPEAPVVPAVESVSLEEDVVVEDVVVEVVKPAPAPDPEPVKEPVKETPIEKARRIAAEKRAQKLATGE